MIDLKRVKLGLAALALLPLSARALENVGVPMTPAQAVIAAAGTPGGVSGVFDMTVKATGRQEGFLYLNSESDYRDQRNMSLDISPEIERALEKRFGLPVEKFILDKNILVRGTAKKTKIYFLCPGYAPSKYYFQTHLKLKSPEDLTVL